MSDEQLIAEVARIWVDGGGDAEGIVWCWPRIRRAVEDEIHERGMATRQDMIDEEHNAQ